MKSDAERSAQYRADLDAALDESVRPIRDSKEPIGILYSGGVDSSVLAWELRLRPGVRLYTVGREGSPDLRAGQAGAARMALDWSGITVDPTDVRGTVSRYAPELAELPWVTRTVLVALAVAIDRVPSAHLLCGQAVDELFLGYAHYRGLDTVDAERRSLKDLERLRTVDWPRTQRIATRAGKEIGAPFLSPAFVGAALRVPIELRAAANPPKRFFRDWAIGRGLPSELAERPKRAMQYGSGISATLRAIERAPR